MPPTFTPVSEQDFVDFFRRGYHALSPKKLTERGEMAFDLSLSDHVSIQVLTTVRVASGAGAGGGEDAIRVKLADKRGRPLLSKANGKLPIIKRTQGWRDHLRELIAETIELYEGKPEYWDQRAGG